MITGHPSITRLLRDGASLILNVTEKRAEIGSILVDWKAARTYARRLRRGHQPDLARQVVVEYPDRTVTVQDEHSSLSEKDSRS